MVTLTQLFYLYEINAIVKIFDRMIGINFYFVMDPFLIVSQIVMFGELCFKDSLRINVNCERMHNIYLVDCNFTIQTFFILLIQIIKTREQTDRLHFKLLITLSDVYKYKRTQS